MAKLIERRFDLDDRISLAIRWHPGDGHALYVSLTARDQRHHLVYCLDDWHMMGQRSRTPLIHDDKLADAFEDFVVGAMFATKGPAP